MPVAVALVVGAHPLSIQDVEQTARFSRVVELAAGSRARIAKGRAALEAQIARGDRIYGVNTGIGGNIKFELTPDQAELLQHNLMRHLSCATGQPLPGDVVRAAMLLRIATFATGASGGAARTGRDPDYAAESRDHARGPAIRLGGRKRRFDAFGLRSSRAVGDGRRRVPGPDDGRARCVEAGRY